MTRTGKYLQDEVAKKRILELAQLAANTPVIAFSSEHALRDGGLSGQAWKAVHETIYAEALKIGLPKITGYYGLDGTNAEFLLP